MAKKPPQEYICSECGKVYYGLQGNFYRTASPLYSRLGYLPICKECVFKHFDEYRNLYEDERAAVRRTCMLFDFYYSDKIYDISQPKDLAGNRIGMYLTKYHLSQNRNFTKGKTFDDTLLDESKFDANVELKEINKKLKIDTGTISAKKELTEHRAFWGKGYDAEDYDFLQSHFDILAEKLDVNDIIQQVLIKDLCEIKLDEFKCRKNKDLKGIQNCKKLYQDTLKNANLKPKGDSEVVEEEGWCIPGGIVEKYTPSEYFKDKKLFQDFDNIGEYFARHILRPLKNFFTGQYNPDEKYCVTGTPNEVDDE